MLTFGLTLQRTHVSLLDGTTTSSWNQNKTVELLKAGLKAMKEDFPSQDKKSMTVLASGLKSVFLREPLQPAVLLLLAGSDEASRSADCLAEKIVHLSTKILGTTPGECDKFVLTLSSVRVENRCFLSSFLGGGHSHNSLSSDERFPDKMSLHQHLDKQLSSSSTSVVRHLERLSGGAALALHAFCDNANAPHRRAVIVLTAQSPG